MQGRCDGGFEEYATEFIDYLRSIEVRDTYGWIPAALANAIAARILHFSH